ncbi:MAG: xanthine dehydrogenase family protein subunit M [Variibacter sp.]|nr:xanthine dehydrogenase family protein subunit M [Variibacter sp.]
MFPASFDYHKPGSIEEALELLTTLGADVKLLAGGHSLVPALKLRLTQPKHLIDLAGIAALKTVAVRENRLVLGAMTTHWQVESSPVVKAALPYLCEVAGLIADPQVRNRGTIGGSLVNADPAADYPASILALDAEMVCVGRGGRRIVHARDWFQGLLTAAIEEHEILSEIRIPLLPPRTAATYLKLRHPASRFAVVGVAAIVTVTQDQRCAEVRIGITGVGSCAKRAGSVEQQLVGHRLDATRIEAASAAACDGLEIDGDMHFSAEDKEQLCRTYVRRALLRTMHLAESGAFQPTRNAP